MSFDESREAAPQQLAGQVGFEVDITKLSSVVLARLVDEVRNDETTMTRSYDRVHNRHNR